MVWFLGAAAVILSGDPASAQADIAFQVEGRGSTGPDSVQVRVNGTTVGTANFTSTISTQTVMVAAGTEWIDLEVFYADAAGIDVVLTSFTLDGDRRTMSVGDVLVSGQWTGSMCSVLGDPIGTTIHCQGVVRFPEDGGDPDPPPELDPSYWGNAQTDVPVYDTAWDLGVSARTEEVVEYAEFLADSGFAGFATTYLGSIHRPAARPDQGNLYTRPDPYGNPIATYNNGNLVMNAAHADRFEDYLDAAHAEGLRVALLVIWERKAIDEYGLINESNAYNWTHQIGSRFKDHPAIQTWTLGGDAETDASRTQLWQNAVNGLRDAGVTGDISFHTGSSPQRRVNQLAASWNSSQMVQTSHCASPAEARSRIEGVVALADIPVWAGEMRYEGIEALWCDPYNGVVTAQNVLDDSLAVIAGGAQALIYGHNDRWQWGHGALGGTSGGWSSVQASFDDLGQHLVIDALTSGDVTPPSLSLVAPAPGARIVPSAPFEVRGTAIDVGSGVDYVRVSLSRTVNGTVEHWDGSAWIAAATAPLIDASLPGNDVWTLGFVDLLVEADYQLMLEGADHDGNLAGPDAEVFTVAQPDVTPPLVESIDPSDGTVVAPGPTEISAVVTDAGAGVDRVRMTVRRLSDNKYWDGSTWGSASGSQIAALADGQWSIGLVDTSTESLYRVLVIAWDVDGNKTTNTPDTASVFEVVSDTDVPDSTIDDPGIVDEGQLTLTGTASDASSAVLRVRVRVRREGDGQYWNGSAWTGVVNTWTNATGAETWSFGPVPVTAGSYTVWAYAIDDAGNVETWADGRPSISITVANPDADPPDTSIDDPGAVTAGLVSITGSATDAASGVDRVRVRVRRLGSTEYWDGTSWVMNSNSWVTAVGTSSWTLPDVDVSAGRYRVWAYSVDGAGNVEMWLDGRPARTFTVT